MKRYMTDVSIGLSQRAAKSKARVSLGFFRGARDWEKGMPMVRYTGNRFLG